MPRGRPTGSRNKRTVEIWEKLKDHLDPIEYLSSLVDNPQKPDEIRIQAAVAVAPYKHSRKGLAPQPVPSVFVSIPIELPHPRVSCLGDTLENIEYLDGLKASGKLDIVAADSLINAQRLLRDGLIEAAKIEAARGGPPDVRIIIEGGLPKLRVQPGESEVIMPQLMNEPKDKP